MILVQSLSKNFGGIQAVDDISFELRKGEVLGFLGPNGAGKSTTMRVLACFIPPTSGTAKVCGFDIQEHPVEVRQQIGYLPESAPSYDEMLVDEFLNFVGEMRGFSGKELRQRVDRVLDLTALHDVQYQMIDTLSKGYRQRTCLAQSLLHDPPVLILDEPTDGLDPNQKHEVRSLIKRMSEERAILVSTHILEEVEAVCSRAIIIAKGKLVANGTPEELLSQSRYRNAITMTVENGSAESLIADLKQIEGVNAVELLESSGDKTVSVQIFPQDGQLIIRDIEQFIRDRQLLVEQLHVDKGRLDEVFRNVTLN